MRRLRYVLIGGLVSLVVWRLTSWMVSMSSGVAWVGYRSPVQASTAVDPAVEAVGFVVGVAVGVGVTWVYARYLESV